MDDPARRGRRWTTGSLPVLPSIKSKEERVRAALALVSNAENHYQVLIASGETSEDLSTEEWAAKAHRTLTQLLHPVTCTGQ